MQQVVPKRLYLSTTLHIAELLVFWSWRQEALPERWYLCTALHNVTSYMKYSWRGNFTFTMSIFRRRIRAEPRHSKKHQGTALDSHISTTALYIPVALLLTDPAVLQSHGDISLYSRCSCLN
jgi:hypothetical protein